MRRAVAVATLSCVAATCLVVAAAVTWPRPAPDFGAPAKASRTDVVPPIKAGLGAGVAIESSAIDDQKAPLEPASIAVPSLGVDMPIVPMGLNPQGGLALPDTSLEAVWYRHGSVPGEPGDAALIAAHVDNRKTGLGPFAKLLSVESGARVSITMSDATTVDFAVVRRERVSKQDVNFEQIMEDGAGMLVLVTCGGRFDATTGHYEDNVIVWAVPTELSWTQ